MSRYSEPAEDRLAGKVAVVTGSSTGIGRALALAFARAGARVAVHYRQSQAAAEEVVGRIRDQGGSAQAFQADVSQSGQLHRLVDEVVEAFDGIHVWVNNAGADILTAEALALSEEERLDQLIQTDLRGTFVASKEAARAMQEGVILNMAWDHVFHGLEGESGELFATIKGGIVGFSRSLARSLAPRIRVNVIAPGWIVTRWGSQLAQTRPEVYDRIASETPLGRWGMPDDLTGAALFLASDEARFVTGQTICVNGGVVMH